MNKKQKGTVAVVVCFVAAIALAGTYTFRAQKQKELVEKQAKIQEEITMEETRDVVTEKIVNEEEPEPEAEEVVEESEEADTTEIVSVHFDPANPMLWPVSGNVLMSYSMDKTVYFKTLDQYRYNPAMLIHAKVGENVFAGTSGIVRDIQETAKTGKTLQLDLGNGYEAFYGQLKDVQVGIGDYVKADTILGSISEPSKYFTEEGANLYLEIRKDGQPVNPVEVLE